MFNIVNITLSTTLVESMPTAACKGSDTKCSFQTINMQGEYLKVGHCMVFLTYFKLVTPVICDMVN